jgi:hypothetical protein
MREMEVSWPTEAVVNTQMLYMTASETSYGQDPNAFMAIVKKDPNNNQTSIGAAVAVIRGNEIIKRKNYKAGLLVQEYNIGVILNLGGGATMWSSWSHRSEESKSFPISMVANYALAKEASDGGVVKLNMVAYPTHIPEKRLQKVKQILEIANAHDRRGLEHQIEKKVRKATRRSKAKTPAKTPESQEPRSMGAKTTRRSAKKTGSESPTKRARAMTPPLSPEPPIHPPHSPNPESGDEGSISKGSGTEDDSEEE